MEKLRERLERNPNRDENVEELFEDIEKAANEVSLEEIKVEVIIIKTYFFNISD